MVSTSSSTRKSVFLDELQEKESVDLGGSMSEGAIQDVVRLGLLIVKRAYLEAALHNKPARVEKVQGGLYQKRAGRGRAGYRWILDGSHKMSRSLWCKGW